MSTRKELKVVRLIEPEMCLDCRFSQVAEVETKDGSMQRMIHCRRLDCDNWDMVSAEPARGMTIEPEAA